jgi:hypothetical protein
LETFLAQYEDEVLENQRLLALDLALKATPARWWGAHKETITDWYQCKRLLCIRFDAEHKNNKKQKYDGQRAPTEHLEKCRTLWKMTPPEEWPHHFIHTLEGIPSKLVYRPGITQRNYDLDDIATKFYSHFLIRA